MADSEQQPFSPVREQKEKRNVMPMVIGTALVAALVAALVVGGRIGKSSGNAGPSDPNLAKLQISDLHMATAQNFAGSSVTYIEGKIANHIDRKVTAARVEVIFKNSLGETAQKEVLPVTVLLPNVPYVDYGTIDRAPLASGQASDFRLTLEHVSADWDGQVPQVRVVAATY
ncbi:MAG TPA: hypothetical protein VE133_00330 [Candidatus Sulfotelmatobacter sp.]|nr:hypothetical protein [Candidatus Sulfotelmatobacter sp.]